jgi:hypothetical protein
MESLESEDQQGDEVQDQDHNQCRRDGYNARQARDRRDITA